MYDINRVSHSVAMKMHPCTCKHDRFTHANSRSHIPHYATSLYITYNRICQGKTVNVFLSSSICGATNCRDTAATFVRQRVSQVCSAHQISYCLNCDYRTYDPPCLIHLATSVHLFMRQPYAGARVTAENMDVSRASATPLSENYT